MTKLNSNDEKAKFDFSKVQKLQLGQVAPDFQAIAQLPNGQIETFKCSQLYSKQKVLLVFYPSDDTPGCTKQLCGIRDVYQDYQDKNVFILGINPGTAKSHLKFIQKYNFPFPIIVDEDKSIIEKYGAIKSFFGNPTTKRGVFLIDTNGKIIFIHWGQQDNKKILNLLA